MQDVNQLVADPVFQGMNGPGGFAADAFAPTVRMEAVESPEYVRWQNYLSSPTSFEGMVAAELEGGGTPYSAIRKIRAKIAEQPEGELAQELQAVFPAMDDAGPIPGQINWQMISDAATKVDELRAEIPQLGNAGFTMEDGTVVAGGGEIMEVIGPDGRPQLVRRIEEPSPLAEKYHELGIPTPDEQYSPESFLGPEWTAEAENVEAQRGIYPEMEQAMWDAYNEWQNFEPYEDEPPPAPVTDRAAPGLTDAEEEMIRQVRQNVAAPQVPTGESSQLDPEVIGPLAEQLAAEGHELPPHWTYSINPDGSIGEPLPPEELAGGAGAAPVGQQSTSPSIGNWLTETLGAGGAPGAQGFMGGVGPLGQPLPGGAYSYTAPRGFDPTSVEGETFWPGGGGGGPMEDSIGEWLMSTLGGGAAPPGQSARQPGGIGHRLEMAMPPSVTIDGQPNSEYQQYLDRYMANQPQTGPPQTGLPQSEQPGRGTQVGTPQTAARQPGSAEHLAEIPKSMIGDWLVNNLLGGAGAPLRTGEEEDEPYNVLSGSRTGERVRYTPQSEARRPGEASHRTEVEGGALRQRFGRAVRDANQERVRFGQERQNVYGAAWGQALRGSSITPRCRAPRRCSRSTPNACRTSRTQASRSLPHRGS